MFEIKMGIPQMENLWNELVVNANCPKPNKAQLLLYKKLGKALRLLSSDPKYPGLKSHEIEALTSRYGMKVWESYLENNTPAAGRIFWVYGPNQNDITVIGLEPHPNDKAGAYKSVCLSKTGEVVGN